LFFPFLLLLCLLLITSESYSQNTTPRDTLSKAFYDTLKARSEKNRITRLLYDFIIVTPDSSGKVRDRLSSTRPFDEYKGYKIRNTQIVRLNAFGTDINDPQNYTPTKGEKFLNASYIKTRRFVLQKYLLFKTGDEISPLTLSDNERLLREIPYIEDARIIVIPVSADVADIIVVVRETYPLGFNFSFSKLNEGKAGFFDRNFAGIGHELDVYFPFNFKKYDFPGIGVKYGIKNIAHTFSNLTLDASDGLGITSVGFSLSRPLVSSETKYAWSVSMKRTYASEDLDTMAIPEPVRYTYQDYWAARSFLLDRESVTRFIISFRYINNNVFNKPEITSNSFYPLQRYKMYIGSLALSSQKYYNTSLIYSYGRIEDIPYGYLLETDAGIEYNEFKKRAYIGFKASYGNLFDKFGYIYAGTGFSTFYNGSKTEQGLFQSSLRYFTPLIRLGNYKMRNFVNLYFIRGFNRYTNEFLYFNNSSMVRGFRSDSIHGDNRILLSIEPVVFTPHPVYGFRIACFAFADLGIIIRGPIESGDKTTITAFGLGMRIRNDQLLFNTIQIRFGYYPNVPEYSHGSSFNINGLTRLKPPNFEPGAPAVIPYN
jgi:hypothetical protein